MSVLVKATGFRCSDCGSDRLGFICNECGQMMCSCKGCDCVNDAEREQEERETYQIRQEEAIDRIMDGDF